MLILRRIQQTEATAHKLYKPERSANLDNYEFIREPCVHNEGNFTETFGIYLK